MLQPRLSFKLVKHILYITSSVSKNTLCIIEFLCVLNHLGLTKAYANIKQLEFSVSMVDPLAEDVDGRAQGQCLITQLNGRLMSDLVINVHKLIHGYVEWSLECWLYYIK